MTTKELLWKMVQAEAYEHSEEVIDEWYEAMTPEEREELEHAMRAASWSGDLDEYDGLKALIRAWEAS